VASIRHPIKAADLPAQLGTLSFVFPRADTIKAIENIISGNTRLILLLVDGPLRLDLLLLLDELRPGQLLSNDWPGPPWTRSILNSPLLLPVTHLE
jgi:hypothetical protein